MNTNETKVPEDKTKVNNTRGDFTKQIMDFRGTWLRAVARASVDLDFRKDLVTASQNGKDGALTFLKDTFDYDCPWELTLVVHDDTRKGPRLNPANGRVMTLPYWGESLTIFIPHKSKIPSKDPKDQMDALAAYYHENSWLLRNKPRGDKPVSYAQKDHIPRVFEPIELPDPPPIFAGKWASVSKRARYELGDDVTDFISFAAAIFNAVALAWGTEAMWNELISYSEDKGQPRGKTIAILNEWLDYNYPWELDLIIQPDPNAQYQPNNDEPQKAGYWESLTAPVLALTLPWMSGVQSKNTDENLAAKNDPQYEVKQNQEHLGMTIMGLALYNTNGPGYPFTCG
jgi:ribosomally synthesized peptide (two-chain TOMM family)